MRKITYNNWKNTNISLFFYQQQYIGYSIKHFQKTKCSFYETECSFYESKRIVGNRKRLV